MCILYTTYKNILNVIIKYTFKMYFITANMKKN